MTRLMLISLIIIPAIFYAAAESIIRNGVPWFYTDGNFVNAHGVCIVEDINPRFVSKTYPEDEYLLEIEVTGEYPVWFKMNVDRCGSTDYYINVSETIVE